jgi:hypothetical protein
VPGLVLQAFALALVLAYYFHPRLHGLLDALAAWRSALGLRYSIPATALFGAAIPFAYMRLLPATRAASPWSHGLFYLLFWGYKGWEVDFFYRVQAGLFGDAPGFAAVTAKVAVDQLLYNPLWAAPTAVMLFRWKELGFLARTLHVTEWRPVLARELAPALISTWGVWLPAVAIIYSLPGALQIPLFNIVLCFYALMFAALQRKKA